MMMTATISNVTLSTWGCPTVDPGPTGDIVMNNRVDHEFETQDML